MAAPEGTTMDTVTIFYVSQQCVPRHAVLKKVIVFTEVYAEHFIFNSFIP